MTVDADRSKLKRGQPTADSRQPTADSRQPTADSRQEVNRTLYAEDCLNVLSDPLAIPPQSVDLIYLDPPFNSKSDYNLPFKGKDKSAKPVAVFKDTWRWDDPQDEALARLREGPATRPIADLIDITRWLEGPTTKYRLGCHAPRRSGETLR